ncbi:MAG: biopolymer transporter ExbD [Bryobacterales bacterium]|nr:biopolymer transporter ExbD [Bryobacterales bacterium]MDE0295151.1 biopolymer transporter ExbD [Bryobacterales bacterium]MDE0433848.1 biopolymer transporter ExbD [Bryobacterales bacterium]
MEEEKKSKSMGAIVDINVTPMVDVMLVLLIIFMVITPMLSKGVSVDLVRTRNHIAMDEADQEDAILIAVTREGSVFLGRSRIEANLLKNEVEDILTTRIDKTVYVKSDARSRYERVVEVVNILRSAGCDQVGLLTEKLEETRSRAAR